MPRLAKVGNGHAGSEDYATLALWWAAESVVDYSGQIIVAECLGDVGTGFTSTGTSVNGYLIKGDGLTYDGTNESSLPVVTRINLTAPDGDIEDFFIDNNSAFASSLTLVGNNTFATRCRIKNEVRTIANPSSSYGAVDSFATGTNKGTVNCIVSVTGVKGYVTGFNRDLTITNCVAFSRDATQDGVTDSGANQFITDSFFFGFANDYVGTTWGSFNNNASEDTSGSAGLTGFNEAELVNYASNDYRTKSSSTLATGGTGGGLVGAFLETSTGITVNPDTVETSTNSQDPAVSLTANISLTPNTTEHTSESINPSVQLSAEVILNVTPIDNTVISLDPTVNLVATVAVVPAETNNSTESLDPTVTTSSGVSLNPIVTGHQQESLDPVLITVSDILLSPVTTEMTTSSENPTVILGTPVTIQPTSVESTQKALNASLELVSEVVVAAETTGTEVASYDPSIFLSTPIVIISGTTEQEHGSENPTVSLTDTVNILPTTVYNTEEALNPQIVLQFGLTLDPDTTETVTESLNPNIGFGVNVEIESFTIKYAADQVVVTYVDNQVQIEYSS